MFYENVKELCRLHKTNITKMARDIGLSNAAAASWRKGSTPKGETLQKIADYFGVSMDSLLSGDSSTITASGRSVVLQGNTGNNTVGQGNVSTGCDQLSDMEVELLRIFRKMDMRKKNAAMSYFYDLEDQLKGV